MKYKKAIKTVLFFLIFIFLFNSVSSVLTISADDREYQGIAALYDEPENSLDAVYIGSSNCFTFWNAQTAWKEFGIAVCPFYSSAQPLSAAEYMIKEARRTQPDAVFVVNINTLGKDEISSVITHRMVDFLPFSLDKLKLTHFLCEYSNMDFEERLEYYLPIIRYHSKWDSLTPGNFTQETLGLKGVDIQEKHLQKQNDFTKNYMFTTEEAPIPEKIEKCLLSLLDYCDSEKLKIMFVTVPRTEKDINDIKQFNTINRIIKEHGYKTLNLIDKEAETGISFATDFYNCNHTNVHGAVKFTQRIAKELIKDYGFKNKHGDPGYKAWDESYRKYTEYALPYILPFELDSAHRDYTLSIPKGLDLKTGENTVKFTWESVKGADGYTVFRKDGLKSLWENIADTTDTHFIDNEFLKKEKLNASADKKDDAKEEKDYAYYTVVPYSVKNGEKFYGNFSYNGKALSE